MKNSDNSVNAKIEKIATELENVVVSSLLEKLSTSTFDSDEMIKFFISLENESDRALAIVTFSFIDDKIKELMMRETNHDISGGPDTLFENFGPLATSSARIKVAAALYWISPNTYEGLELLRKIRNEFAHRPFLEGFNDTKITGYLNSIYTLISEAEDKILNSLDETDINRNEISKRILFHMRAALICQQMVRELLSAPIAIRMGLHPFSALNPRKTEFGSDKTKTLDDVLRGSIKIIAALVKKK